MEQKIAVEIRDLVKDFSIVRGQKAQLKSLLFPGKSQETFRALDGVTANFHFGERVGLIGLNGSGKSTLSTIISGITPATSGHIAVNGTVSMLNTSVGLNPRLTGRESIYYKCLLLGFRMEEIQKMEPEIIKFASIGMHIDQPLRTYSSGMRARLGFAISSQLNPDILVVDEALAVGDDTFAAKCEAWMTDFCQRGRCIIFVSHSLSTMKQFCQKVLWLHHGHQVAYGDAGPVLDGYWRFTQRFKQLSPAEQDKFMPTAEEFIPKK